MTQPTVLSLFSGVGGFDIGFENAGFRTAYQCEWDKHATSILNRHWPDVPKWGDIQTLTADEILRHGQAPDVVIWGSPCQDLSVAGKRAGLSGERSGLFHEGIRIIKELREATNGTYPRISVWENVAGALNSNGGADFGVVLDEMAKAGALVIEWALLDAQHFGVPQRRRRVFVVAVFDPATASRCPDPLLPVGESVRGNTAKGKSARKDIASTLGGGSGSRGWSSDTDRMTFVPVDNEVAGCLRSGGSGGIPSSRGEHLVVEPSNYVNSSYGGWVESDTASTLSARDYKSGTTITSSEVHHGEESRGAAVPTYPSRFKTGEPVRDEDPIFFHPHRSDGARIQGDTIHTLTAFMGTGGLNTPMVAEPTPIQGSMIGRSDNAGPAGRGYGDEGGPMFTLNTTDRHAVAYPIQDGREMEKRQNGMGVGGENDPSYTIDQTGAQAIAFSHTQGLSAQPSEDAFPTLRGEGGGHAVAYDEFNDALGGEVHHSLRAGTRQSTGVLSEMTVRRLTPMECERLMGWPDGHTDGQADSHRYRQCGNGVASPVAEWIAGHLKPLLSE